MTAHKLRIAQYIFAAVGSAALGYCGAARIEAEFFQARTANEFKKNEDWARKASGVPKRSARLPAPIPIEGGVVGRLSIPRLGVSVTIVEGVEGRDLRRAVGHIPGTPLPGQPGKYRDCWPPGYVFPSDTFDSAERYNYPYHFARRLSLSCGFNQGSFA